MTANDALLVLGNPALVLAACEPGNDAQLFTYDNSTTLQSTTIMQGSASWGFVNGNIVLLPPVVLATGIASCSSSSPSQAFTFTGSLNVAGSIVSGEAGCVAGACTQPGGCRPLPFVPCNASDPAQQWVLQDSGAITSVASPQYCLDVYAFTGPLVGAYLCNGGSNQHWLVQADAIVSLVSSTTCLTDQVVQTSSAVALVVDELGTGSLTFQGGNVGSQCVGVCAV